MRAFIKHVARRQAIAEAVGIVGKACPPAPAFGGSGEPPSGGAVVAPFPPSDAFELALWIAPERKLDLARNELFLRSVSAARYPLIFEIAGNTAWIRFTIRGHRDDEQTVRHAFKGLYPDCGIQNDANAWWKTGELSNYYEAIPSEHFARITMPDTLTDSLLWALTEWLMSIDGAVGFYQCVLQSLGPSNHCHRQLEVRHDLAFLERLIAPQSSTQRTPQQVPSGDLHSRSSELLKRVNPDLPFFAVSLRCGVIGLPKTPVRFPQFLAAVRCAGQALQLAPAMPPPPAAYGAFFQCGGVNGLPQRLNSAEATVLAHFLPAREDLIKRTDWPVYRGPVSTNVLDVSGTGIGHTMSEGRRLSVFIPWAVRERATHILSASGGGKSTMAKHMALQCMKAGNSVVFIDARRDAITHLLAQIPREMWDRVQYLNPGDPDFTALWNPLALPRGADLYVAANNLVAALRSVSHDWGDRLEAVLSFAVIALLHIPGSTVFDLFNLLRQGSPESEALRARIIATCPDETVIRFWQYDFLKTYRPQELAAPRHKLQKLISGGAVSRMLAQRENRFDLRAIMDGGAILLVDLSQVGKDAQSFLGAYILALLVVTAISRTDQRSIERRRTSIYIDEAHLFLSGDAIETLVSQLRKYKVGGVITHQYLGQFRPSQVDALLTAGTTIVGRVDRSDATLLAKDFPGVTADEIGQLRPFHMIARIDGDIVRIETPPSNDKDDPARVEALKAESYKRYYVRAEDTRTRSAIARPPLDTSVDLSYDEF